MNSTISSLSELDEDAPQEALSTESTVSWTRWRQIAAWLVHLFTASGGVVGLLTVYAIHRGDYILSFWLAGIAIFIDSIDGIFARTVKVKSVVPSIDGALLDNIIDYVNYVAAPAFFLLVSDLIPSGLKEVAACLVMLSSAYQFTQSDAKTWDHFFKGFPSYWNIVVFYLFFWQTSGWTNFAIISFLSFLVFVPIKYVYPSRLDHFSCSTFARRAMLFATVVWGLASLGLLYVYPGTNHFLVGLSAGYVVLYVMASLYRTFFPLQK